MTTSNNNSKKNNRNNRNTSNSITTATITINSNTTFAELKNAVPDASKKTTPQGRVIVTDPKEVSIISVQADDGKITVYESGFFSYLNHEGCATARAVHSCSKMKIQGTDGKFESLPVEMVEQMPFSYVLEHFGKLNIEDQKKKEDERKRAMSLDGDYQYTKGVTKKPGVHRQMDDALMSPDISAEAIRNIEGEMDEERRIRIAHEDFERDQCERKAVLKEARKRLTAKQEEAVAYFYDEEKSVPEIGRLLHITRDSARDRLRGAEKKMKKLCGCEQS